MSKAEKYYEMIVNDDMSHVVSEEPALYTPTEIRRIYEFDDGAVVEYEWRSGDGGRSGDGFNHRFTLVKTPSPNPDKLKKGVIKTIMFPQ
jgi:hypothetical protein